MDITEFYHREIDALTLEALLPFTKHGDVVHQILDVTSHGRQRVTVTTENYFHARCCKAASEGEHDFTEVRTYRQSIARGGIHIRPASFMERDGYIACSLCRVVLGQEKSRIRRR